MAAKKRPKAVDAGAGVTPQSAPSPTPEEETARLREEAAFPIVGVGASAGGLEAVSQLLKALPVDTGMGFVLVQHLAPSHPSMLPEILSRTTKMPVMEVNDEPVVEPNHVYIIPPNRNMVISGRKLHLSPRDIHVQHRAIDLFL